MSAPYDEHIGTHWEGCETERNHHQCALARLEEARRERDEYSCAMMDEEKAKNALTAQLAAAQAENEKLRHAATRALNYITNTESELGITLESGELLRAALAKQEK